MRVATLFAAACGFAAAPAADPVKPFPVPRLVGHRALIRHAPEQTLAAFNAAIDLRIDLEIDVRRTREGKLVCLHDDTVDRTTSGKGRVAEMSLREVQALDAGAKFDPAFAGERVPMLEELFALLRDRKAANTLVAVDLKIGDDTVEEDVVKLAQTAADLPAAVADPDSAWVYCRFLPTAEEVKAAHAAGKRVFVVGTLVAGHEPDNWAKVRAAGADAVLTDYPLECRAGWRAAAGK